MNTTHELCMSVKTHRVYLHKFVNTNIILGRIYLTFSKCLFSLSLFLFKICVVFLISFVINKHHTIIMRKCKTNQGVSI